MAISDAANNAQLVAECAQLGYLVGPVSDAAVLAISDATTNAELVEQCARLGAVARDDRERSAGPTIVANLPGRCIPGDDQIRPGDLICVTTEGRWAHTECCS